MPKKKKAKHETNIPHDDFLEQYNILRQLTEPRIGNFSILYILICIDNVNTVNLLEIPHDMLDEILCKLPICEILRIRRVCKKFMELCHTNFMKRLEIQVTLTSIFGKSFDIHFIYSYALFLLCLLNEHDDTDTDVDYDDHFFNNTGISRTYYGTKLWNPIHRRYYLKADKSYKPYDTNIDKYNTLEDKRYHQPILRNTRKIKFEFREDNNPGRSITIPGALSSVLVNIDLGTDLACTYGSDCEELLEWFHDVKQDNRRELNVFSGIDCNVGFTMKSYMGNADKENVTKSSEKKKNDNSDDDEENEFHEDSDEVEDSDDWRYDPDLLTDITHFKCYVDFFYLLSKITSGCSCVLESRMGEGIQYLYKQKCGINDDDEQESAAVALWAVHDYPHYEKLKDSILEYRLRIRRGKEIGIALRKTNFYEMGDFKDDMMIKMKEEKYILGIATLDETIKGIIEYATQEYLDTCDFAHRRKRNVAKKVHYAITKRKCSNNDIKYVMDGYGREE